MGRGRHRRAEDAGWARGGRALARAFEEVAPGSRVEIGRVRKVGDGLFRSAWGAEVELVPDPMGLTGRWVALVPGDGAPDGVAREVELLAWLRDRPLPFRVPRAIAAVPEGERRVLVREWLGGGPLEMTRGAPWEVIGPLAAAVHALAPPPFVAGPSTRREHAMAVVDALTELGDPVAAEAASWAADHVPDESPAVLLHGDLLGQNVLLLSQRPPALIDWEYAARGDPAYDLAIVTRGGKRPFGVADGLSKLVEAYTAAGGRPVTVEQVRIHELGLVAGWALAERAAGDPPSAIDRLRGLLRRCREAAPPTGSATR